MTVLTSKQRRYLEKCAHSLEPVVIVGGNGVSPQVVEMISRSLDSHELLKVKFNEFKDEKVELTDEICSRTDATLVRIIGNVAILFRQNEDASKRKFSL